LRLRQCSRELEIISPIDQLTLVISRRPEPKADLSPSRKLFDRQEVATINFGGVGGESIDLVGRV
jgi:hypothetical protein